MGQVQAFQLGGSPVPPTTVRALMDVGVRTQNAFGMTENHSFQYTRPDDPPDTIASTCGRPADGMEIKLWREDDRDREVAQGDVGELGVRGASMMLGYFDDQSRDRAVLQPRRLVHDRRSRRALTRREISRSPAARRI